MIYNKYCYVIRNSKNLFYKFSLNKNKNLLLQVFNYSGLVSSSILNEQIKEFSLDIDSIDRIHLVYTTTTGSIKYLVYPSKFNQENITIDIDPSKFNAKFLKIKIINSEIHIFYALEDKLNSSNKTLNHIFKNNKKTYNLKIANIFYSYNSYPYTIDTFENYIYMFYCSSTNNYSFKKFDIRSHIWSNSSNTMNLNTMSDVSFIINSRHTAIACYNNILNKNIQLFLKYKDLSQPYSEWSTPIMISDRNYNATHSSVFIKDTYTYILWEEDNRILFRKSLYGTNDWTDKNILTEKTPNLFNATYVSNHSTDKNYKNMFTIMGTSNFPYPIVNLEKGINKNFYIENQVIDNEVLKPIRDSLKASRKTYIDELKLILSDKDKKISELSTRNDMLQNELDKKNNEIKLLNIKLNEKNWLMRFFKSK